MTLSQLFSLLLVAFIGPFSTPKNDVSTTLASPHTAGATTFVVQAGDGAKFAGASAGAPIRFTAVRKSDGAKAHFLATGVATDTLTASLVTTGPDAGTDLNFAAGDTLEVRMTAGHLAEVQSALTDLDTATNGVVNVKSPPYSAAGDGTTNDRAAIQAAAAAAISAGKPLYFPPGTYLCTFSGASGSSTAKVAVTGNLDVLGSGQARTKIQCGPNSPAAGNDYQLFVVSDGVKFTIRDIELAGPATVDTSTNPDVGANGGTGTAATNAILCNDCTAEAFIKCKNVKFSGQWFMDVQMSTGAGTARFEMDIDGCDFSGYAQCIAFFAPDGADRTLHVRNTRFRQSGIAAANNNGTNYGHSVYIHPNCNFDFRNCRWDNSVRYGLHYYSSGGRSSVAKYARLAGCYFGPGITEGILFADNGCPQMVGGKYEGAGNIIANTQVQFLGVDFNPIGGVVSVAANGSMVFDGCRLGSRFQLSPSAGTYVLSGCVSLQGDPLPGSLFGTLASRPTAATAGNGAIYYATDTFDTYTSNGTTWTQVVGTCPITNNGATIQVNGGRFRGNLGSAGSNSGVIHASGTTRVRGVLFDGKFGNVAHNAPIDLASAASGSVVVDSCNFNATGTDPIWSPAATPAGTLRGAGNTFAAGTPNVATNAQYLGGRAGQAPSAVASATTITPDVLNYDTFHLTGTTQVDTIVPASTQAAKGFSGTIRLICDAAVAFGSGGNISPRSTSARTANDVVILTYDPASALWYEPLTTAAAGALSGSGTNGTVAKWTGTSSLGNATAGTDYVLPTGVAGGQTINLGLASGNNGAIYSTAHATKGTLTLNHSSATVDASGNVFGARVIGATALHAGSFFTGATLCVNPTSSGTVGFQLRGAASQASNLFDFAASNGTTIYNSFDKLGRHIVGAGATAPTIAAGTGAGTSPTIAVQSGSSDEAMRINVTTGTSCASSATVFTVTFSAAYGATPRMVSLTPANAAAAALTGNAALYIDAASTSTTVCVGKVGSTALADATPYIWYVEVR